MKTPELKKLTTFIFFPSLLLSIFLSGSSSLFYLSRSALLSEYQDFAQISHLQTARILPQVILVLILLVFSNYKPFEKVFKGTLITLIGIITPPIIFLLIQGADFKLTGISDNEVEIKKSTIGQFEDGLGVFVKKGFKKDEIVLKWSVKKLNKDEFNNLLKYERENFCHHRNGIIYFYPDPERHVNRSKHPNVIPDFNIGANIALCDIEPGEELSIPMDFKEDFN